MTTTTNGFSWTEIKPGYWRDESTGLLWGPEIGEFTHAAAEDAVDKLTDEGLKWTLPNKREWMFAELHDVREVLPLTNKWFWSSLLKPNLAWVFSGGNGYLMYVNPDFTNTARAVGR